jgi:tRNA (adenine22-N1)-methyltransferase
MLKLSQRLQTIADFVPPGARAADIGSDHALLPVYLVQSGKSPSAVAGEVNAGPLKAASGQIAASGLERSISARLGDGLSVIAPGEVDCVTIAGMGGALMADILDKGATAGNLDGVRTLVLQPNVGEDIVRAWLMRQGWYLAAERLLEEDGKFYEVLLALRIPDAEHLQKSVYDPHFLQVEHPDEMKRGWLLRMGPWLLRQPPEAFYRKWADEQEKLRSVCAQIDRSQSQEAQEKSRTLRSDIDRIGEVLACLHMDRPSLN